MAITPAIRELIDSGPLAHVTTLNPDGSPQVSVVWVAIDGDEFVTAHMGEWQKIKNLRNDPRVALSLLGRGRTPWVSRNIWSSTAGPESPREARQKSFSG